MNTHIVKRVVLAAGLGLALMQPVFAQVSATQCNFLRDGVYVPGLRVVIDGRVFEVVVGERGLRRSSLYRADKIEAYTRGSFWLRDRPISVSLGCGVVPENDGNNASGFYVPTVPVEPELPSDEQTDGDGPGDEVENEQEEPGNDDNDGRDQQF